MTADEINNLEQRYEDLRNKILIWDRIIKKIPFRMLQMWLLKKKLLPLQDDYKNTFKVLREVTRAVYPERFIGDYQ